MQGRRCARTRCQVQCQAAYPAAPFGVERSHAGENPHCTCPCITVLRAMHLAAKYVSAFCHGMIRLHEQRIYSETESISVNDTILA